MPAGRKLKLKQRAERMEDTRRRIVEATVELHQVLGATRTTISAIAERAGVQRLTVYHHFPDEGSLFAACTNHYNACNPPPDPASWAETADPEARLRRALADVYAYHRRTEPMFTRAEVDLQLKPALVQALAPYFAHWSRLPDVLAPGWDARDPAVLRAALAHALDFGTWRSLVRGQGLTDEQAIDLMVAMVRCGVNNG